MNYTPIKIDFFINDNYRDADVFIKIGATYVHYLSKNEYGAEQIISLRNRGCEQIYLNEIGIRGYVNYKKQILSTELGKEQDSGKCLSQFVNNYKLLQEFYTGICGSQEKAEYIQGLGAQSLQVLNRHDSLKVMFNKAKEDHPEELILKEMISFFAVFSLKYFDCIDSDQLKKFNIGILLTDICLSRDKILNSYVPFSLTLDPEILNHPKLALDHLPSDEYFHSSTIMNLVSNHHERPDGSGYPAKLSYFRFDLFLCTYYLAECLVKKILENNLNLLELKASWNEVLKENKQYSTYNFERAFNNYNKFIIKGTK